MSISIIAGIIFIALFSYLYGSICWAIIFSRRKINHDIRLLGDGNPGAYNIGKTLGMKYGLLVMLLDCTKGLIPALLATSINFSYLQGWAIGVAGCCSVLGHCYPLYFKFKGGNGYSTIFGFMLIYNPCMILEWGVFVFLLTLLFKYIRPMQLIAITLTGSLSFIINWNFYWRNLGPLLTVNLAKATLPIVVMIVALIQLPRFIPYFIGIFKGTEEKMHFFTPLFRKKNVSINNK